jgi:hypothetical protein
LVGNSVALRKFGIASKAKRGKNNQARMGTIPPETIEQIAARFIRRKRLRS